MMLLLFKISVHLSVEPLTAARLSNHQCTFTLLQGFSNLIFSISQFTLSVRYAIKLG